jgi:dTDP-4-dehydrorhamnose 3,5-epimerase
MALIETNVFEGVKVLEKTIFYSDLGYFSTIFSAENLNINFVQDSVSKSMHVGTIRGMHFQKGKNAQAKLINVIEGSILDIFVDLRETSSTYLSYGSILLDAAHGKSLFIPRGFAHGFITLKENSIISYKLDNFYNPESEETLLWNDPDIGIIWPKMDSYKLSQKDQEGKNLKQILSQK